MKLALCYFDTAVSRMFVEKTDEKGEKTVVLSSPYNFVYRDELVAKVINVDDPADADILGIAAWNGRLVVSVNPRDEVWFIDAETTFYPDGSFSIKERGK